MSLLFNLSPNELTNEKFSIFLTANNPADVEHAYLDLIRAHAISKRRLARAALKTQINFYDKQTYSLGNYLIDSKEPAENGLIFKFSHVGPSHTLEHSMPIIVSYKTAKLQLMKHKYNCIYQCLPERPEAPHLLEISPSSIYDFAGLRDMVNVISEYEPLKQFNFTTMAHPYSAYIDFNNDATSQGATPDTSSIPFEKPNFTLPPFTDDYQELFKVSSDAYQQALVNSLNCEHGVYSTPTSNCEVMNSALDRKRCEIHQHERNRSYLPQQLHMSNQQETIVEDA